VLICSSSLTEGGIEMATPHEDALSHIYKIADRSRTMTKRLAFIRQRAKEALEGIPYNRDNYDIPDRQIKSPYEYEKEISNLKNQLQQYREILDQHGIWK
jgi:hypothetical protein